MRKHTPGDWGASIVKKGRNVIAAVWDAGDDAEQANARLIATAPELLSALKELVNRCDGAEGITEDGSNIQTILAHAVIQKAEGTKELDHPLGYSFDRKEENHGK